VQGYLFSPAVPADECAAYIANPSRIAAVIDSISQTPELIIGSRRT
jgi:hypothetical protein